MNTSTSSATIEKLIISFATHGLQEPVTDNGNNFVSREFEDLLRQNGVCHNRIALYQPASNGMAERGVQTIKEGIKTHVSRFLARYRITPQTSTGVSLAELLLGRRKTQIKTRSSLPRNWHMTGTLKSVPCRKERQFMQAISESGIKWMPEVLKQSTGRKSFAVQQDDRRLLRRHKDFLIPRSSVIQEPIADQEVPPPQAAEQPGLQLEKPVMQPTEPVQSAPIRYPKRKRQAPRCLADFVTEWLFML